MNFSVSVIIPAYNVEQYIEKAILSALQQPEVKEVVVVNDGSTDTTQHILKKLQEENPIIKVYHHENNLNKGRSASRNLGIQNATANYIAFLDADDFYLHDRFKNDKIIFDITPKCDGVYNAIGAHFYRDIISHEDELLKLTTIRRIIEPEKLFEALITGKHGHFSIDGLTVKRAIFMAVGLFQEKLKVSEDTEILWRMALKCHLETGIIDKPVAMRGVHDNNVFSEAGLYKKFRIKMCESLIFWSSKNNISQQKIDLLLKWLWLYRYKEEKSIMKNIIYWASLFTNNAKLFFSMLTIKYFPLIRLRQKLFPFLFR